LKFVDFVNFFFLLSEDDMLAVVFQK